MWLFILYLIIQATLWIIYHDFNLLSKSSDFFVILSTLDIMNDSSSFSNLLDLYERYIEEYISYSIISDIRSIRRAFINKLDKIFGKGVRTLIFTGVALLLKFYS